MSPSTITLLLAATSFQVLRSSGRRTARTASLFVRTSSPSRSLILGSEPPCLQLAISALVPTAPPANTTPRAVCVCLSRLHQRTRALRGHPVAVAAVCARRSAPRRQPRARHGSARPASRRTRGSSSSACSRHRRDSRPGSRRSECSRSGQDPRRRSRGRRPSCRARRRRRPRVRGQKRLLDPEVLRHLLGEPLGRGVEGRGLHPEHALGRPRSGARAARPSDRVRATADPRRTHRGGETAHRRTPDCRPRHRSASS